MSIKKIITQNHCYFVFFNKVNAQISVGTNNTENNFSLDLNSSSTNDKGVVLPKASGEDPFKIGVPTGTLLFNLTDSLIYYSTDVNKGFNSLSPWNYSPTTNFLYYNNSGKIGIGTDAPVTKLTISNGFQIVSETDANGYLAIKNNDVGVNQKLLKLDINQISYSHSASNSTLNIQRFGGTLKFGTIDPSQKKYKTNLNVTGRVKEDGNDLLPAGTIIMYSHDTIPAGWGICDGTIYQKTDGTGSIQSPDLSNRFIVGAGDDYTVGDSTGGKSMVKLTLNEMPVHNHNVSIPSSGGHTHDYGSRGFITNLGGCCCKDYRLCFTGKSSATRYTNSGNGSHTHTVTESNAGNDQYHENRPPFIRLIYLMKL